MLTLGLTNIAFQGGGHTCAGENKNVSNSKTPSTEVPSTGLLVLTHGSPSPNWSQSVDTLIDQLRAINAKNPRFKAIEGAHLEFCAPDAATGIKRLELARCDRIVVVPAFVFPTSHSHFDVPAVLGLYSSPSIRETLRQENANIAKPTVPVTVVQTLHEGNLLEQFVLDETKALSQKSSNEVLLLIAHGDEDHEGLIDPTMRKLVTKTCGQLGLAEGNWAYCEVGQSYDRTVTPLIQKYTDEGKRVLVVGLYLATSAEKLDRISQSVKTKENIHAGHNMNSQAIPPIKKINRSQAAFSPNGIISHPQTPQYIMDAATF
ncbi:MAG: CbiX/SirB N-terminal domain-containing protein [Planctomycetia bacterium]|nr:CbiX/SirB N-terminal domain-containing protein [Planctomycetia bacterium]